MYVLGVGPDVDDQELNDVASRPQNVYKEPIDRLPNFGPRLWDSWRDYRRNRGNLVTVINSSNSKHLLTAKKWTKAIFTFNPKHV